MADHPQENVSGFGSPEGRTWRSPSFLLTYILTDPTTHQPTHRKFSLTAQVRLQEVWTETEHTKPPDYLKESELVALMDKHGIGTDASIPGHVQNICDRGYCMVCGPGEDGQRGSARETRGGREPGS